MMFMLYVQGVGGRDPYAIWAAQVNKTDADSIFRLLPGGQEGLVSGTGARDVLMDSGVETNTLRHIWDLSDCDKVRVLLLFCPIRCGGAMVSVTVKPNGIFIGTIFLC